MNKEQNKSIRRPDIPRYMYMIFIDQKSQDSLLPGHHILRFSFQSHRMYQTAKQIKCVISQSWGKKNICCLTPNPELDFILQHVTVF